MDWLKLIYFVILAALFGGDLAIIAAVKGLTDGQLTILNVAAGGLLGLMGVAVNFEYGSSKGSQAKDAALQASLAQTPGTAAAAPTPATASPAIAAAPAT